MPQQENYQATADKTGKAVLVHWRATEYMPEEWEVFLPDSQISFVCDTKDEANKTLVYFGFTDKSYGNI